MSEAVFDYIVDAVHLIANDGWKLLPLYRFDPATGLGTTRRPATPLLPRRSSTRACRARNGAGARARAPAGRGAQDHPRAKRRRRRLDPALPPEFERIRWFPLPGECAD